MLDGEIGTDFELFEDDVDVDFDPEPVGDRAAFNRLLLEIQMPASMATTTEERARLRSEGVGMPVDGVKEAIKIHLDNTAEGGELLRRDQEVVLAKTIEHGKWAAGQLVDNPRKQRLRWEVEDGLLARRILIEANRRLVVSIAKQMRGDNQNGSGSELMDLVQAGNFGLEVAADKFDWRQGNKFSTCAHHWIYSAIQTELAYNDWSVRMPRDRNIAFLHALRDAGHEPEALDDEFAEIHRVTVQTSVNKLITNDPDSAELGEHALVDPEDLIARFIGGATLDDVLAHLSPLSRDILVLNKDLTGSGDRMTIRQIADEYDITEYRVEQIIKGAKEKLARLFERGVYDRDEFAA